MPRRRMSVCLAGVCIAVLVSAFAGSFLLRQPHASPTHSEPLFPGAMQYTCAATSNSGLVSLPVWPSAPPPAIEPARWR
jgi:hypothetical protein